MERSLRVKRIYSLGQYQNIELSDEIVNIPEEKATDERFVGLLTTLQLLNLERRLNKYYLIREKYRENQPEEAFKLIEDEIAETKAELFDYLKEK